MSPVYLEGGDVLIDSGSPAVHADCCCGGCGSCGWCVDDDSPAEVEAVFSSVGDVTPLGCDADDDEVNSAGECASEFNGTSIILECISESAGECYYEDKVMTFCDGKGTNGAVSDISFAWRADFSGSSGKIAPTITVTQDKDVATHYITNWIQWNGDASYDIDCQSAWSLTFKMSYSTASGNYPCHFGSATAVVTPV